MRTLFLVLLSVASAFAQPRVIAGPNPADVPSYSDGTIAVHITDSEGNGLHGVQIILLGNPVGARPRRTAQHAWTDAAGQARFSNLSTGHYWVDARMAGRVLADRNAPSAQLSGPEARQEIELILHRVPVITGRVLDETGMPLHEAQVKALTLPTEEKDNTLVQLGGDRTDDRGIFRIPTQPGRYFLMASHMEMSFPRGSAPRPTGIAFYPNSSDVATSLPLELDYDDPEMMIDITLPRAPRTEMVAGIMSGPAAEPCKRCRFALYRVEGEYGYEVASGFTAQNPGFDYRGIPAGDYRVLVSDRGTAEGWWAIEEAVVVEGRPAMLSIATRSPIHVSGRVALASPPAEWLQQQGELPQPVRIHLNSIGHFFFATPNGAPTDAALSLDQTEFRLGPLTPDRFRLEVWVQNANAYVAGIKRQGRSMASRVLDLSQLGPWNDLEVEVRFDLAELDVQVDLSSAVADPLRETSAIAETSQRDARRGRGASRGHRTRQAGNFGAIDNTACRLVFLPAPSHGFGIFGQGHCTTDGHCYAQPLPPGRYQALAISPKFEESHNFRNRETWKRFEPWTKQVTLTPGKNPRILLPMADADPAESQN